MDNDLIKYRLEFFKSQVVPHLHLSQIAELKCALLKRESEIISATILKISGKLDDLGAGL